MNFLRFAEIHGVLIRDLRSDGRVHRCPTLDKPRHRNGAYRFTGDWGWVQNWAQHAQPVLWRADGAPAEVVKIDLEALRRQERERREKAARTAAEVVARCRYDNHPYLDRKGFKDEQALVDFDGRMVVPMRDVGAYGRVNSVQWISSDGEKKFLPGGAAKGSVFVLGNGPESWLCEGYATGLSVRAALKTMYRQARVVVCFSAGNLATVADRITGRRFVVADNDASGTGERYAAQTGLPFVMPPDVGMDFNDLHQARGVRAVADIIRRLLHEGRQQ